ncbi:hypothetical protein INR49_006975, partial [Caranx melampygus]
MAEANSDTPDRAWDHGGTRVVAAEGRGGVQTPGQALRGDTTLLSRRSTCSKHPSAQEPVLDHGQVLSQVPEAHLDLLLFGGGQVVDLGHQQVGLVPKLGCLPGVGAQQ